jgi:small-conductance mechanosensitive channel
MSRAQVPTPEEQAEYKRSAVEVRRSLNFSTYYLCNPPPSTMPTVDSNIAQRFGVEEVGSLFWPCLLAIMLGVVNWHRHSFSIHIVIVAIGAVASLVIPLFLVIHCVKMIQVQSRPAIGFMVFYTTLTFVPYAFALYLILFLGLYSGLAQFSLAQLIQSLLFIVAGHCIARKLRRFQEFQSCVYEQLA